MKLPLYLNKHLTNLDLEEQRLAQKISGFATGLTELNPVFYIKRNVVKQLYHPNSLSRTGTMFGICNMLFDKYSEHDWFKVKCLQPFSKSLINENLLRILIMGHVRCTDEKEQFKVEFTYSLKNITDQIDKHRKDFLKLCEKKITQQNPKLVEYLIDIDSWCFFSHIIVKIIPLKKEEKEEKK